MDLSSLSKAVSDDILNSASEILGGFCIPLGGARLRRVLTERWLKGWICSAHYINSPQCPDGFDRAFPPELPAVSVFMKADVEDALKKGASGGYYTVSSSVFSGISSDFESCDGAGFVSELKENVVVIYSRNFRRFKVRKDFLALIQSHFPDCTLILSRSVCVGHGL